MNKNDLEMFTLGFEAAACGKPWTENRGEAYNLGYLFGGDARKAAFECFELDAAVKRGDIVACCDDEDEDDVSFVGKCNGCNDCHCKKL